MFRKMKTVNIFSKTFSVSLKTPTAAETVAEQQQRKKRYKAAAYAIVTNGYIRNI
jgi:hypothetical protein